MSSLRLTHPLQWVRLRHCEPVYHGIYSEPWPFVFRAGVKAPLHECNAVVPSCETAFHSTQSGYLEGQNLRCKTHLKCSNLFENCFYTLLFLELWENVDKQGKILVLCGSEEFAKDRSSQKIAAHKHHKLNQICIYLWMSEWIRGIFTWTGPQFHNVWCQHVL